MSPNFVYTSQTDEQGCRRPNERFHRQNAAGYDRYGGGSVMICEGLSRRGRDVMHVLDNGSLTGQRDRDEILHVHIRPYAGLFGPNIILIG